MSETEEKSEVNAEVSEEIKEKKEFSLFGTGDEESIQEICNRYLNIFRQIHVLSESAMERYNAEIKKASEDVIFDLYNMPGGLELVDYITYLNTGERVNSRRLRARQKQEEEMGLEKPKAKAKVAEVVTQTVAPQPVVQYIPMPMPNAEGGDNSASMQAMMAQFVSMQQTSSNNAPSFSGAELAKVLSESQKEIANLQTRNFIEGQKAIVSGQTKGFIEGQKVLIETQEKISLATQQTIVSMQEKLLADARESMEKSQRILFAMQKSMLDEMASKIEKVVGKIAENAKPTVDYAVLSELQEKIAATQMDMVKNISKENIEVVEKVAESIKGLQIVSNNVINAVAKMPENTVINDMPKNDMPKNKEPVSVAKIVETDDLKSDDDGECEPKERLKESDFLSPDEDEFIRRGREKRKERFKKRQQDLANNEDTFAIKKQEIGKNSVFVANPSVSDDSDGLDDENNENDGIVETVTNQEIKIDDLNDKELLNQGKSIENTVVADEIDDEINQESAKDEPVVISDDVGGTPNSTPDKSPFLENEKESELLDNTDDEKEIAPPKFNEDEIKQPESVDNEPPLDEVVEAKVKDSIYNRPKVEDIKPNGNAYIPAQGSSLNLPPPGVMSEDQLVRTERNIGFAINSGSYKIDGSPNEKPKNQAESNKSFDEDPFSKKVSPKTVGRFKTKKTGNQTQDNPDKKGIFSVFKKFVAKDDDNSDTSNV